MASQSNVALNTRSMNGIITLSDGAGTTISNGVITTNTINAPFLCETNQPETISGLWNFTTLPTSNLIATNNNQFLTKGAFDPIDSQNVKLTGNQTITSGVKTFAVLPQASVVPILNAELANKFYVDNQNINNMNLITNQTVVSGIKTFNSLPQSSAVPTVNTDLTNKLYVDSQIGSGFVTLTTNQTITGIKTFDNGLVITESAHLQLEATGTNHISANSNIITYNAGTAHNFGTFTGSTTISDGVYCKKLAVGLSGKAQTYLNYANISNIITASTTLVSTFGSLLDSLYFVLISSTPIIVTLPSVSNDNLGTVLTFYKNNIPAIAFQLAAVSGNKMYSSDGVASQNISFPETVGYIKVVAIKNSATFGWVLVIGKDDLNPTFNNVNVLGDIDVETGRIYFGPTNSCEIYNTLLLNVNRLVINAKNTIGSAAALDLRADNSPTALITTQGIFLDVIKAYGFGTQLIPYGLMKLSGDRTKLQLESGTFGGLNSGIEFLVNSAIILSLSPTGMNIGNKAIIFSGTNNGAGTGSIQSTSNGNNLILHSFSGVSAAVIFQCNSTEAGFISASFLSISSGYRCKQGNFGGFGGNTFNYFWTGANLQCWIDGTFVGLVSLFSDHRLKENICCESKSVLERLSSIKLFEYDTKDISIFKPSGRHYGFFAHEFQEAFPELDNIITGEKDEVDTQGNIVPQTINLEITNLYLRAIQELNDIVKKQQAQIAVLNARLGII